MGSPDHVFPADPLAESQIRQFMEAIVEPTDQIEIRYLHKDEKDKPSPSTRCHSEWYMASQIHQHVRTFQQKNDSGYHIFFSPNPRMGNGKTKSTVASAPTVFLDFDHDAKWESISEQIERLHFPPPTVVLNSGHGIHIYWKLTKPFRSDQLHIWSALIAGIIQRFGSDASVKDEARVMRLPGFLNVKHPIARCYLLECHPERQYDPEYLCSLVDNKHSSGNSTSKPDTNNFRYPSRYIQRAIQNEVELVRSSSEGIRNTTLNTAAFNLGTLIANHLDLRAHVEAELTQAAREAGLGEGEIQSTIKSGLDAGLMNPRPNSESKYTNDSSNETSRSRIQFRNYYVTKIKNT